ncbi:protein kinase domain-containing protein [Streptomyces aurantiogriseus]
MTFPVDPPGGADPDGFQAADPHDGLAAPTLVDPDPAAGRALGPDPRPDPDRLPPSLTDRFQLLEPLPRHGERTEDRRAEAGHSAELRASVFRVQDRLAPDRPVRVLKWFHPAAVPDARVTALLRPDLHAGLSYVLEEGTADGAPYHLLPSHGSSDLAAYLRGQDGRRMPADGIRATVARLHGALAALHAAEVVHRDVKPSNLVLGDYGHPAEGLVLVDFGIAVAGPFPVTAPAGWSGTLRYSSPQAVLHRAAVRPEDDWWALGMVVAEAALGRHPIPHTEPSTVGQAVVEGDFGLERIGDRRLRLLCEGLLTQRPEHRWGAPQVEEWLTGGTPRVMPRIPGPHALPDPTGPAAPTALADPAAFADPTALPDPTGPANPAGRLSSDAHRIRMDPDSTVGAGRERGDGRGRRPGHRRGRAGGAGPRRAGPGPDRARADRARRPQRGAARDPAGAARHSGAGGVQQQGRRRAGGPVPAADAAGGRQCVLAARGGDRGRHQRPDHGAGSGAVRSG